MEKLIRVIDCDLINPADPFSSIRVWYSFDGKPDRLELCGFAFFNWLPLPVRSSFSFSLENYWLRVHPRRRDRHVAAHLEEKLVCIESPELVH